MTAIVHVDTNVLIYSHDESRAEKRALALEWLEALWALHAGRISAQVLAEFFNVATTFLKPGLPADRAAFEVATYQSWRPRPTDVDLMTKATGVLTRFRFSWWDSLIVASAIEQNCTHFLTEDLQHGQVIDGRLAIIDPFQISPQAVLSQ